jgi:hypothetical protein
MRTGAVEVRLVPDALSTGVDWAEGATLNLRLQR